MLNREELMRLALSVGLETAKNYDYRGRFEKMTVPEKEEVLQLERFAELVAAKEREACADECDATARRDILSSYDAGMADGAELCADAIRARGATDGT